MSPELSFVENVAIELTKARKKHTTPIHSMHEGIAVVEEEFWESKLEVFKRDPNKRALYCELVQTAAMCQRMAEDLNLHLEA